MKTEPDAWLVTWTEGDSKCRRVFDRESDALEWAAKLGLDRHVAISDGEVQGLFRLNGANG